MGLVVQQGILRSKRAAGINTGPDFTSTVHSELRQSSEQTSKCIGSFASTTEALLIKYKKGIIDEQMVCTRLADAAIDIFGMISVISRASKSLTNGNESADHESAMCQVFCSEAAERVQRNLSSCTSSSNIKNDKLKSKITADVVANMGTVAAHPLGF